MYPRSRRAFLRGSLCVTTLAAWSAVILAGPAGAAGEWVWPLRPRPVVVNGFDAPEPDWLPGHRGVDLAGSAGQPVHSAGVGEVTYAGLLAGVGIVVVRHGALRTTYQPVEGSVDVGERVTAGAVIGRLAERGSHCAPAVCLHWGLKRGHAYLDPLALLGMGPVRLLPQGNAALQGAAAVAGSAPAEPPAAPRRSSERGPLWVVAVGTAAIAAGAALLGHATGGRSAPRPRHQARG